MKFMMVLLFSSVAFSQVILIPDQTVDFNRYQKACGKEGYLCTMKYNLEQVRQMETPQFNELVNQLDYSSETFRNDFVSNFFKIAKEESLSLEQIEILQKIIEQLKEFSDQQRQKQFNFVEKQLNELVALVKVNELTELPAEYLIVFQKPVPLSFIKNLKPNYFKMKIFRSSYQSPIDSGETFVAGLCESAQIHPSLQNKKWQIESEKVCGFAEHFSQARKSTGDFMVRHQTGLITAGLVLVGTAILMNNYELKFTF